MPTSVLSKTVRKEERMSDPEAPRRLRERRRAAHRAVAGLFLQQTIESALVSAGELNPDEHVEVTRNADGVIVCEKKGE